MTDIFDLLDSAGAQTDETLERFMDDEEMYLGYVRAFPEEPTMNSLCKAVENKDYTAAEKAVHALKGIVINLGFSPLADACLVMLKGFRDGNIPSALQAFDDVQQQYDKFCNLIKSWRSNS